MKTPTEQQPLTVSQNPPPDRAKLWEFPLLSLADASIVLNTSQSTIRELIRVGRGPTWFKLGRKIHFRNDDLRKWVESKSKKTLVDVRK